METEQIMQERLDGADLGPDSDSREELSAAEYDLASETIQSGANGLRMRPMPDTDRRNLCELLEVGQKVSIGGIGYQMIRPKVLLTDLFDGKGPEGCSIRGH